MATLSPQIQQKFTDANGNPLAGGKIYTYEAGTTTPLATYTDYGGLTANANPIILDANGECNMWLGSRAYKIVIKDSADVTIKTVDNVGLTSDSTATSSNLLENVGVTASVASNALTINLTDARGNTPSSISPVVVGFRSSTISSGLSSRVSIESTTALVVPAGATLGTSNSVDAFIYVYLINNAGTAELAVSGRLYDDLSFETTTAISAASDLASPIYSQTARTSVPCRLIARLKTNQTTAGNWAAIPTEIEVDPIALNSSITFPYQPTVQVLTQGSGAYTTPAGCKYLKIRAVGGGGGGAGGGTASVSSNGSAGGNTSFNATLIICPGGPGVNWSANPSSSLSPTFDSSQAIKVLSLDGYSGGGAQFVGSSGVHFAGGNGGSNPLGIGGFGRGSAGGASGTGYGAGGAGGGSGTGASAWSGAGGCSGAYFEGIIKNPQPTYSYVVGGAGAGGGAGTSGFAGANGIPGVIIVEEYYI